MIGPFLSGGFGFTYQNNANGGTTPGTAVTPGAGNAEGSWTQIATSSNIAEEVHFVRILISGGATSGQRKDHWLDIGIDPAGGTSYTQVLADLSCGRSDTATNGGRSFQFPIFIPAGASVAARIRGSNLTAGSVRVFSQFWGKPLRPECVKSCQYFESIGVGSSSDTAITPGTAAFGSWTLLGTTTKEHWWGQLGHGLNNTTTSTHTSRWQLGVGDGTNIDLIAEHVGSQNNSSAITTGQQLVFPRPIPAGSSIYARAWNSGAPDPGYHCMAVLGGG